MAFSDSNLLHGCACLCFRSENRAIAYGRASPRRTSMKQCSQTTTTRNPWPRSCPRMSNTITPRCCSPTTLKSFIRTRRRSTLMESRSRDVAFFHGERHMPHTHCTFSISCILHAAPAAQFKTACTRAMLLSSEQAATLLTNPSYALFVLPAELEKHRGPVSRTKLLQHAVLCSKNAISFLCCPASVACGCCCAVGCCYRINPKFSALAAPAAIPPRAPPPAAAEPNCRNRFRIVATVVRRQPSSGQTL